VAPLLEARRVTKIFGGGMFHRGNATIALTEFSLAIDAEPPTITAIVGESGSGKTTLIRTLLRLATPTQGDVRYRGTDVRELTRKQRRNFLHEV
jgi:ABC-type oligopeptide transport system ATPase subunit